MNRQQRINNWLTKRITTQYNSKCESPLDKAYQARFKDQRIKKGDYTKEQFRERLESQFEFAVIGWFNYGSYWSVDHIIPISKGGLDELTNLRPLPITQQALYRTQ